MSDSVSIEVHRGFSGLETIKAKWLALANREGFHFLHFPGWYEAELATRDDDSQVYFLTLSRASGDLCAVIPLELKTLSRGRVKLPVLQLFYENEMGVNDLLSVISLVEHRKAMVAKLRERVGYFAFIRWQCILQSGCAVNQLVQPQNARFTHESKFIDFSEGLDSFWEGHTSKFRRNIRKKLRKAEEQGALSLVCATEGQALEEAFATFLEIEDSGWKGEGGTSVRKQPKKLAYYQELLRSYRESQQVQINILYLDQQAIAVQFCVHVRGRLYLLKIGFSEAHSAISPGYLILYKLIEQMAGAGQIHSLSFVTGVDWIDRWHPDSDPVGIAYSDNGTSHSRLMLRAMQWLIKRRRTKKPVSLAQVDEDLD